MNDAVLQDVIEEDAEQSASRSSDPNWSVSKVIAIVLGAPLAAFTLGVLCIAVLPIEPQHAFAWGFHVMVPLWVAFASLVPLARDGRAALGACLLVSVLAGLALWLRGAP